MIEIVENIPHGIHHGHKGFTPYQVEHHVRTKLATPILHVIYHFQNHDIFFYIYITINAIFLFFLIVSHLHFCSSFILIQLCVILVINGIFY